MTNTIRYLIGDVRKRTADIPDGSVSLIVTSPPFLRLRSYLPPDHPDKHAEVGAEPDPASFIDTLLAMVADWSRVLAPWGSIAVELGDTFAGSGGAGGDYRPGGMREGQPVFDGPGRVGDYTGWLRGDYAGWRAAGGDPVRPGNTSTGTPSGGGWPLRKSKCWIPEAFGFALSYGVNPYTGQRSPAGQWIVRNAITWARTSVAPGFLGDKYRPATSLIMVATRDDRRYFDLDAVRTKPVSGATQIEPGRPPSESKGENDSRNDLGWGGFGCDPAGAPPRDWGIDGDYDGWDLWVMNASGYSGSHYAVFPPVLPRRLVDSMSPRWVCPTCGLPRRRIVDVQGLRGVDFQTAGGVNDRTRGLNGDKYDMPAITRTTVGWTDCGCGDGFIPGVVFDPFAGSGTTLMVAAESERDAVGIDVDERNVFLARDRVASAVHIVHERIDAQGMTLLVDPTVPSPAAQIPGQTHLAF